MPNTKRNYSPHSAVPPRVFQQTKQWIFEICEKIGRNPPEARNLAYKIITWLEYLGFNYYPFSRLYCPRYIQLFALLLVDIALNLSDELRRRCPTKNLYDLAYNGFTPQDVYTLHQDLELLNFQNLSFVPLNVKLQQKLDIYPDNESHPLLIKSLAWILLDSFVLQFFGIQVQGDQVALACIAVARYWVLEKEEDRWPESMVRLYQNVQFHHFLDEYKKVEAIARETHLANLKKRKEQPDPTKFLQRSTIPAEINAPPLPGIQQFSTTN